MKGGSDVSPRTQPDNSIPPHNATHGTGPASPLLNNPGTSAQQTANPSTGNLAPGGSCRPDGKSSIRSKGLGLAKTTFKTVDAISGTIPVAGSYIGAAAKVGLVVVEMVEVTWHRGSLVHQSEYESIIIENGRKRRYGKGIGGAHH